jgi:hypothetical protein
MAPRCGQTDGEAGARRFHSPSRPSPLLRAEAQRPPPRLALRIPAARQRPRNQRRLQLPGRPSRQRPPLPEQLLQQRLPPPHQLPCPPRSTSPRHSLAAKPSTPSSTPERKWRSGSGPPLERFATEKPPRSRRTQRSSQARSTSSVWPGQVARSSSKASSASTN